MPVLLRQVVLRNYKSIAQCKVDLTPLTVLIGPNGAGKSNFIDALRLVSESLNSTLEYGIRQRGGISEVRRRSGGHPNHFTISLRINLGERNGHFAFQIGAKPEGAFYVKTEQALISSESLRTSFYHIEDGKLLKCSKELSNGPQIAPDRLFLTAISGVEPFRSLFDALSSMAFYSIGPAEIRELQPHDRGDILARTGRNLAAVVKRLSEEEPNVLDRIQEYLKNIVSGITGIEHKALGPRETLEFRQTVQGQAHPWRFYASAMSDGTLRSLGVLTALFHAAARKRGNVPFVAIEEPEITIHPGAAAIIMDALFEASKNAQVVATTHSPDLIDHPKVQSGNILAVQNVEGNTVISPVDEASVSVIRDRLYTAGELMRKGQLQPALHQDTPNLSQSDLFPTF